MLYDKDIHFHKDDYSHMAYKEHEQEMAIPKYYESDGRVEPSCGCRPEPGCGCEMGPVMEPPVERCVKREIVHRVHHVCPVNTKIINHHIIEHVYSPHYTCCEEDVVTNLDQGHCCY
jgi:hypothetical protein